MVPWSATQKLSPEQLARGQRVLGPIWGSLPFFGGALIHGCTRMFRKFSEFLDFSDFTLEGTRCENTARVLKFSLRRLWFEDTVVSACKWELCCLQPADNASAQFP